MRTCARAHKVTVRLTLKTQTPPTQPPTAVAELRLHMRSALHAPAQINTNALTPASAHTQRMLLICISALAERAHANTQHTHTTTAYKYQKRPALNARIREHSHNKCANTAACVSECVCSFSMHGTGSAISFSHKSRWLFRALRRSVVHQTRNSRRRGRGVCEKVSAVFATASAQHLSVCVMCVVHRHMYM